MENVAHATAEKTQFVANRPLPLHLSQATKRKRKYSIIFPVRENF